MLRELVVANPKNPKRPVKHPAIRLTKEQHALFIRLYPTVTDIQELLDVFPEYSQKELTLYAVRCQPRIRLTKAARATCQFRDPWAHEHLPKGPTGKAWHHVMIKRYIRRCIKCRTRCIKAYMVRHGTQWYCEACQEKLDTMHKGSVT